VLPAEQATVPLLDDGFLRGDAVFDAMLVRGGRTHARERHLARLRASARTLGLRVPVLTRCVDDLLAAWGEADGSLKVIVTRGGLVRGLLSPVTHPGSLSLSAVHAPWRSPISGTKTLSYAVNQWAGRQARAQHADDALVVDPDGHVLELPTAAVVLVVGDRLLTPDPTRLPILASVSVEVLSEVADVERATPTLAETEAADELLVLSATRLLLPVHALDDADYPAPGPVGTDLRERLVAHVDATLD
jgi:branched-subunit amino acid aminotransferase/4-amino-4-deoxychorismate lyase